MPIYEYNCEACHETQEIIQKFGEGTPEMCPLCHAKGTLKKQVTSSSFHLKGGGWYKDLYSSSKETAKKTTDTGSETKAPAEEKGKKDSDK